jgi:Cd2+/Zn2+-exporting ATPase
MDRKINVKKLDFFNYELTKISSTKNYKRILNEIKKVDGVLSASIDKQNILHICFEPKLTLSNAMMEEKVLKAIRIYEPKAQLTSVEKKEVYRKVLYLIGLDCAYCGARIETLAKRMFSYEKIVVDYPTLRFIIETTDKNLIDHIEEQVSEVAHRIDSRIQVVQKSKTEHHDLEVVSNFKKQDYITYLVGLVFAIVGIIYNFNFKEFITGQYSFDVIHVICFSISYLLVGHRVLYQFLRNLSKGHFLDENFLMTVASFGAIATNHILEAVMVMALYRLGEYLQELAVNHTRKSISKLLAIDTKRVKVRLGTEITEIDVESAMINDIIVVNKGDLIPLDGKIISGKTLLDVKNLTGESLYKTMNIGDEVLSGSINMGNPIEIKVIRPYGESMVTKILDLVENASESKAKSENFISNFSKHYTPIVVCLALLLVIVGFVLSIEYKDQKFTHYLYLACELLVISCPCALVISVPLGYFCGIGIASRRGILIKGSNYLEALAKVNQVVFDKTGTLTKGQFAITKVISCSEDISEKEVEQSLIYTEYYSTHPIGTSIVEQYGRENIFADIINDFSDIKGGAKAIINGSHVMVGNATLMKKEKIALPEISTTGLVVYVAKEKKLIGYVIISDTIREEAYEAIRLLRKEGITRFCMLTGDTKGIAESVGKTLGIEETYSELLPSQKVEWMSKIKQEEKKKKGTTMFVGDGINDAPVIATSDVGVAMGSSGSDATISIADVVIMSDNLQKLSEAKHIAKEVNKRMVFNVAFIFLIKLVVMALAVLPEKIFPIALPLWIAVLSDVGVSLIAILNSLTVLQIYPTDKKEKKKTNAK